MLMYCLLDRYIGKTVFYNMIIILFILISLSSVIKFVDELRKIGQGHYGAWEAWCYVCLDILKDVERFLPMAVLLGTLLGLGIFSTRNELIVMEIFGFSRLQMVSSLMKIACPVIIFGFIINEYGSPVSERVAQGYRYKMIHNVSIRSEYNNVWIKDGYNFIRIEKIFGDHVLSGIHIYHFDNKKSLKSYRYVTYAKFVNNSWDLLDVYEIIFNDFRKVFEKSYTNGIWVTVLTPHYLSIIIKSIYHSTALSIFDVYGCIQYFRKSGQNISQYQLFFWKKVLFPISMIVMMLVALSCVLRSLLHKLHIGVHILIGVIYSFFFIF